VAYYILNSVAGMPEPDVAASELLRSGMWGVDPGEHHAQALAAGDRVLVYAGAPRREFVGSAELGSAVHVWTPAEARVYPGSSSSGVALSRVEEWDPPVRMTDVLARLDPSAKARADFDMGVVRITEHEYETAAALAPTSAR
jgi:hypothetical protein